MALGVQEPLWLAGPPLRLTRLSSTPAWNFYNNAHRYGYSTGAFRALRRNGIRPFQRSWEIGTFRRWGGLIMTADRYKTAAQWLRGGDILLLYLSFKTPYSETGTSWVKVTSRALACACVCPRVCASAYTRPHARALRARPFLLLRE